MQEHNGPVPDARVTSERWRTDELKGLKQPKLEVTTGDGNHHEAEHQQYLVSLLQATYIHKPDFGLSNKDPPMDLCSTSGEDIPMYDVHGRLRIRHVAPLHLTPPEGPVLQTIICT